MSTPAVDPPGDPRPRPSPGPLHYALKAVKALASLQLTVVLFALGIGLVFLGTLAQIDYGIWTTIDKYFWSWYVMVPLDLLNKFGKVFFDLPPDKTWGGAFPFPGGITLALLMFVNLIAAHLLRFRLTWKRSGVLLIHSGLVLLLVGEFITREYSVEQQMTINEGESVNYAEDTRNYELAFVRTADGRERATVVPQDKLQTPGGRYTADDLPVAVEVVRYMRNADYRDPKPGDPNPATAGAGLGMVAVEVPEVSGVETEQRGDIPAAYVKLSRKDTGEAIGTFLVTPLLSMQGVAEPVPGFDGLKMTMRRKRLYKPFSIHLIEFRHDQYIGTDKAKNFSSRVVVVDPEEGAEREVVISMNEPLRHRGETFYQANWDKRTEKTTMLQVVRNPGWQLPYASCIVVTLGMLVHFGIYLTQFLRRRAAA
jgi:hypothetical protein